MANQLNQKLMGEFQKESFFKSLCDTRPGALISTPRGAGKAMASMPEIKYDPPMMSGYYGDPHRRPRDYMDLIQASMERREYEGLSPDGLSTIEREAEEMCRHGLPFREGVRELQYILRRVKDRDDRGRHPARYEYEQRPSSAPPPQELSEMAMMQMDKASKNMQRQLEQHAMDSIGYGMALNNNPGKKVKKKAVTPKPDLTIYEQLQAGVDEWLDGVLPQPA